MESKDCEICYGPAGECDCDERAAYYDNLTPEEWLVEQRLIDEYVGWDGFY